MLAIGASALYQYVAIKFLDRQSPFPGQPGILEPLVAAPGDVYGVMLASFFIGSVLLVASSARQLMKKQH